VVVAEQALRSVGVSCLDVVDPVGGPLIRRCSAPNLISSADMVSSTSSLPSGPRGGPTHLNSRGCIIKSVPGRGRGVYGAEYSSKGGNCVD
jgi:hypothetical protein